MDLIPAPSRFRAAAARFESASQAPDGTPVGEKKPRVAR